jgi:hypothetical protein
MKRLRLLRMAFSRHGRSWSSSCFEGGEPEGEAQESRASNRPYAARQGDASVAPAGADSVSACSEAAPDRENIADCEAGAISSSAWGAGRAAAPRMARAKTIEEQTQVNSRISIALKAAFSVPLTAVRPPVTPPIVQERAGLALILSGFMACHWLTIG